ncbi:MAG: siderophore biosynthesis protein [Methylotenera sp.]|nr:MAG: siderophore biosynthesis protein [Methylotenera sp.]
MPTIVDESDWAKTLQDVDYICQRVVDTLLREDVRQCVSIGHIINANGLPDSAKAYSQAGQLWLQIDHIGNDKLWIPVKHCAYMQSWRLSQLPLLCGDFQKSKPMATVEEILGFFRQGLDDEQAQGYFDFEVECKAATEHRSACEKVRSDWFANWHSSMTQACGADLPTWHQRLQHYDRLAAFQDHPFYPTARAKLGFNVNDLAQYAPEFQPEFELNWLAVPKALYSQQGDNLPQGWPDFAKVGLTTHLAETHTLVPVHPFVWNNDLDEFLSSSGLANQCIRAPNSSMLVEPTLSVRTLALCEEPAWHLKLPLTIRTLGGRNIRTIKPSTIADGHRIQTLLSKIIETEPALHDSVLLSAEDTGAHVAQKNFLGFIIRRYPQDQLQESSMLPVAALAAKTPAGKLVVEEICQCFYKGNLDQFIEEYLTLTLNLHLTLWIRYGIALESNQQNSMLVLQDNVPRLRLLLKDNDAARINGAMLEKRWPDLATRIKHLEDKRILVNDELPLAQMFTTITLQLNIAALVEAIAALGELNSEDLYKRVKNQISQVLNRLEAESEDVTFARRILLEEDWLYIKYLLVAATLVDKQTTGASDVNKYYGRTAPNFLRETHHEPD